MESNHFRRIHNLETEAEPTQGTESSAKNHFSRVFLMKTLISKHLTSLGTGISLSATSIIQFRLKVFETTT